MGFPVDLIGSLQCGCVLNYEVSSGRDVHSGPSHPLEVNESGTIPRPAYFSSTMLTLSLRRGESLIGSQLYTSVVKIAPPGLLSKELSGLADHHLSVV